MMRRTNFGVWALVGIALVIASIVDDLAPWPYVMTPLYAIPPLIASAYLSPRSVLGIAILVNVLNTASAQIQGTPSEIFYLYGSGLILIGILAVFVSAQRRSIADLLAQTRESRAEAKQAQDRLEAILESAPFGIIFSPADGNHLIMNPAARRLFPETVAQNGVRSQLVQYLRHPSGQPLEISELVSSRALAGETALLEERIIAWPDGRQVPISASSAPVHASDGAMLGAVTVLENITDRKNFEQARDAFLAAVSHDIRNPLMRAVGYCQILQRRLEQQLTVDSSWASQMLRRMDQALRQLTGIIGEILDVSYMSVGQPIALEQEPTNVVKLVRQIAEEYQALAEHHRLQLELPAFELVVKADVVRIQRVLGNLLSNAMKYSPSGSAITVRVGEVKIADGDWVAISVQDQGIGIPVAELSQVFEYFHRASNVPRATSGGGIGLASVKHIIELHGGQVRVVSEEGVGTTFTVLLPRSRPE